MPKLKRLKLDSIKLDEKNANRGTNRGREFIEGSLRKYGLGRSILLDKDGNVIAGNKTLEAFRAAGGKEIIVVGSKGDALIAVQREDLTIDSRKGRSLAIADNRASEINLDWSPEVLASLDLKLGEFFHDGELRKLGLLPNVDEGPEPQLDRAAELQEKWKTERGQIWEIGKHRLMCGDSTSDDVRVLMGVARADCMWTDPPYGVSYVGKTKQKLTIDNDSAVGLVSFLEKAFAKADAHALRPGSAIYIAHPSGALATKFAAAFVGVGWRIHQTLVWVKDSMVLGHSDYHYRHEPILFGYKLGGGRRGRGGEGWYGGNSETSVFEIARPKASQEHPTMKPPSLVARMVANSCPLGGLVFDPFVGSGTIFVAAEQTGRVANGCEIDPKYVAVALERVSEMGLKPKLTKNG
jgi:site-specific DNA-methyltransferase (adenine-specific)